MSKLNCHCSKRPLTHRGILQKLRPSKESRTWGWGVPGTVHWPQITNRDIKNQYVNNSLILSLHKEKISKEVSENTAKGWQGKGRLQIANYRLSSLLIDNSNYSSSSCTDGSKKHEIVIVTICRWNIQVWICVALFVILFNLCFNCCLPLNTFVTIFVWHRSHISVP